MGKGKKVNLEGMPYGDYCEHIAYPEGLKWTKQRKAVYRVLWEAESPLTAIQIYNRIEKEEDTHYAVCLECHRRIPLKNCPFSQIHMGKEAEDFTVTEHKLELYGYCKECREGGKVSDSFAV